MDCVGIQIEEYLKRKSPVEIYYNNENGEWLYSIQVVDTVFWLDSFSFKSEAIDYCEFHELPYTILEQ